MKKLVFAIIIMVAFTSCQNNKTTANTPFTTSNTHHQDSTVIRAIFDTALSDGKGYEWLRDLTQNIGHRLSGSPQAAKAVLWGAQLMRTQQFDSVWLQPIMVPHWVRGPQETAYFQTENKKTSVAICALGGSVATPKKGVSAEVIELNSLEQVAIYGEKLRGKIVFFNRPFDLKLINTFDAYSGCVDQRWAGAHKVGTYGALGVIVRSMTNAIDDFPHTGSMGYKNLPKEHRVPAAAISTIAANALSAALLTNPSLKFYFKQSCKTLVDAPSFNVIGEIKGSEFPDKYITVGGHLDSWDLGEGAHDDGTGVVQSLEVLRIFKANNIQPRHSIRTVLFMNEENGNRGGKKYAAVAKENNEIHIAALESDSGGHTPRGFSYEGNINKTSLFKSWKKLLAPYGLHDWEKGHTGVDIRPLKSDSILLAGYKPDSQRYFDYHHSANDTFDKVNERELQLGTAAMTSLIYLLDQHLD
ncbi:MAG: M20/M25/M40 family metallo-hydrolase [Flavobacteriaceae bacterium]|nr:M20/M25/M40 family metallo-hydrolase [Flavobacteriaceae bacterium]